MFQWLYRRIPHIKHLNDCLCEAYDVHGHSHGVGKGEDETDGASELRPKAPGDQVVRSSWTAVAQGVNDCFIVWKRLSSQEHFNRDDRCKHRGL